VHPGDLVVADGDGVLVIPPDLLETAVVAAAARAAHEAEAAAAIEAGASLWDVHALEEPYRASGIVEVDPAREE